MTWQEAAFYCRSFGTRLAILDNPDTIEIISNSMTKARPDFENLWIGAHYSYGGWTWIATGVSLSDKTNTQGYPPWQNGYSEMKDGCLLLDRHLGNGSTFVETACDRKRDFICQKYPEDEEEEWLNEPVEFTYNQSTYIINPVEKTWEESREYCQETGSVLAYINDIHTTNVIIEAMGDHPKEISHVWMGGHFQDRSNEWQWIHSGKRIETKKDSTGFPPWVTINEQLDYQASASKCLNLDRTDHTKPHFYGLDCSSKQPFVCQINLSFDEEIVTDKQNVRHPEKLNETEKELTTTLKPTVTVPYISKETTRIPISIATTNITETATESYSPLQAETPSPLKIETSSHSRTETSSSSQTETFSPTQTEAFSPTQTETFSPTQPETFSPSQTKSYSPLLTETTNPSQTETSNPSQTETYSPSLTETSDLSQIETSNLSQTETSSPSQTETTNPSQTETFNPSQTETTNPSQTETTNPSQTETSNPSQTETSNPSQIETTNLSQTETSSPSQTETSGPSQTETYTPSQTETNVEGTTTQLPEQMAESATFIMPEIKIINETDLSVTEPFPTTLE
ncbi:mucin-2-like [Prorops nasuta]|uniref:mucin-2-like n=1 Tax=Prorops nasuta TaxID=863751 RepID=UPI0034CFEE92